MQPVVERQRQFTLLMQKQGIADALLYFRDSGLLRSQIYMILSEVDPYFDLNEHEYNTLLCRDFGLGDIVAEIQRIIALGYVSYSPYPLPDFSREPFRQTSGTITIIHLPDVGL